ncbi:MAG: ABC transporter permease [Candidatus Thermoplasmatota archaeon]|nr:ABC transporter permease [Candidatus Thermoplasmatota archaeon]MBU4072228.1 ABC transporter permease [Candidatus Thermoplasmatota archaeon]MBU4145281.1 ABC transporter permease [Candidatus Thermoplasmatota archaeon]MBU4591237.1 ABC transporter permease [Candidatus Thermoplasmatota archaeon]
MGIDPIGYKPWNGQRSAKHERILVISWKLFMSKMKNKWMIGLLVLGYIGVFAFPIILYSLMPHEVLDGLTMSEQLGNGLFFMFTVLLASLVCSDSISEDLRNNSFVLYFSRAIGTKSYLAGKMGGVFFVLALFCFFPPIIMALAILGTQSGSDYLSGLGILGLTVLTSLVTTVFLIPFSVLVSSLTKRKTHAAIGTFMTFTVLAIISSIFSEFDRNWNLMNPGSMLAYFYDWIFGVGIPHSINGPVLAAAFCAFIIVPLALVYLRIHQRRIGK